MIKILQNLEDRFRRYLQGAYIAAAMPRAYRAEIWRAIRLAAVLHAGQRRGFETQMDHVLRVAEIAVEQGASLSLDERRIAILAAILHDVLEDTPCTDQELAEQFGERVAQIVRALSHESEEEPDEIYLRRVAAGGPIAILVKRFDRLDNLAGLRHMPLEFRARKCAEVRAALPIWYQIDPDGAPEIEKLLKEVEHVSPAS